MSASKPLIEDEVINPNDSTVKDAETQHDKMISICSVLTSTVHNHDDGEEITAPVLAGVNDQALESMSMRIYHSLEVMATTQFSQYYSVHTQLEEVFLVT